MGGGGKGGSSCYTTGFRYFAGLHLIFCQSVDAVLKIVVGEKTAWEGRVAASARIAIDQPDLFGGEGREGGVRGPVDLCFGEAGQPQNPYLQSQLGPDIPAFRGLFGLVAGKCMLSANNPYIKPWSVLARRTRTGWHEDLAEIPGDDGHIDMNPAHIIREALTNTGWGGLGYPEADLDDASFLTAANLLKAESFGLSLIWAKNTSVEDFVRLILNHIDGVLYFAHSTGLLTLRLIRDDYNIGALPVVGESNTIELVEFTNPSAVEVVNQVTVNYVDRENMTCAVTVQDIAGISRMGGQINAATLDFPGVTSGALAARIAARELTQLCMPISSCTLEINRVGAALEPGDCFNFTWGPLGIAGLAMRVSEVEIGVHTAGSVRIKAVRDVFGLGSAAFTAPAQSLWTRPESKPADAANRQIAEITWWQFVREYAGESEAVMAELSDTSTLVVCFCCRPSSDAYNYEMWVRNRGAADWSLKDTDSFPFTARIDAAAVPEVESLLVLDAAAIDTDLVRAGTYACLGGELVAVLAVDAAGRSVTVARGVLDTIPAAHAERTVIWFHQGFYGLDTEPREAGETVEVKLLPSTPLGRLALDAAAVNAYTTRGRMMRPYPPGNVRIGGKRWPSFIGLEEELTVSWAHRSRTAQTVSLIRQDEGSIGPEAGVTYIIRIYGETGILLRTVSGLTGTGFTYPAGDEKADSGFDPARLNKSLRMELEAVRGSLVSFTKWNLTVTRGD
ncbi:MAG: phage tail protein [Desulfocapsaceae bacterium]|nr:phage tail protein [Desulfocapsaceae bacterium]